MECVYFEKKRGFFNAEHIITIMFSPARIVFLHLIELFHFKVITSFLFNYILNYLKVQQTHMPEHNILL